MFRISLCLILLVGVLPSAARAEDSLRQLAWGARLEEVKSQEAKNKGSKLLEESQIKKRHLLEYRVREFQTDVSVTYYFVKKKKKLNTIVYRIQKPCLGTKDMPSCHEALVRRFSKINGVPGCNL